MRHRQRHLHKTIVEHIRTELDDWITTPGLFGGPIVTLLDYEPQEAGETPAYNTVSVSIGDQLEDKEEELGGGLYTCVYAVFIDIYPTNESVGVALADDIKVALTERVIPLLDYSTDPDGTESDEVIEFEQVMVEILPTATTTLDKRSWRCVKATAVAYF